MESKPTLKERWNYWFDNFMARGTIALIGGLGLVSLAIILLIGGIVAAGKEYLAPEGYGGGMTFIEASWYSLMRTMDAGTMVGFVSAVHYVHPDKGPELWINEVSVSNA